MRTYPISFTLSYVGGLADGHEIDLCDVAQALMGFQRSLALTTHLVLNGEIITQAPSLKGARISAVPPYASAEDRLPEAIAFAESVMIFGELRAGSVHEVGYGHKFDWAAA